MHTPLAVSTSSNGINNDGHHSPCLFSVRERFSKILYDEFHVSSTRYE